MSQYCSQCGTENLDEAKFCKSCGFNLLEALQKIEQDKIKRSKANLNVNSAKATSNNLDHNTELEEYLKNSIKENYYESLDVKFRKARLLSPEEQELDDILNGRDKSKEPIEHDEESYLKEREKSSKFWDIVFIIFLLAYITLVVLSFKSFSWLMMIFAIYTIYKIYRLFKP